ncbi:uncharacterized protein [Asterias amurensis]|uniref:uncharacterized protein n=1 Tax=Asterias amurensis TaxID=7602 RepID=UPI003AB7F151
MEENNLNIPPTEEPIARRISRIASQLMPLLLPASTFFIGWLAERRVSIQLSQLSEKQEQYKKEAETQVNNAATPRGPLEQTGDRMTSFQRKLAIEDIQRQEELITERMMLELDDLRPLLKERQQIFCNMFTSRENRFPVEKELKDLTYSKSYDKELGLYKGMQDILRNDKHCGDVNHDGGKQGCLMWVYMDFWKAQIQLMKYKNIYDRVKKLDET